MFPSHRLLRNNVRLVGEFQDVDRSADWLKQPDRDLRVAETDAAAGYHEWAAFAAQQCAEKGLLPFLNRFEAAGCVTLARVFHGLQLIRNWRILLKQLTETRGAGVLWHHKLRTANLR